MGSFLVFKVLAFSPVFVYGSLVKEVSGLEDFFFIFSRALFLKNLVLGVEVCSRINYCFSNIPLSWSTPLSFHIGCDGFAVSSHSVKFGLGYNNDFKNLFSYSFQVCNSFIESNFFVSGCVLFFPNKKGFCFFLSWNL